MPFKLNANGQKKKTAESKTVCSWGINQNELSHNEKTKILTLRKTIPNTANLWFARHSLDHVNLVRYRQNVKSRFPAERLNPIQNLQLANSELQHALNPKLKQDLTAIRAVLNDHATQIRPLNCLESLIFSSLIEVSRDTNNSLESFVFILESAASRRQLLIYALQYPPDQKPYLKNMIDQIAEDTVAHWSLRQIIHAHPHRFDKNGALSPNHIAPRYTDLEFFQKNWSLLSPGSEFVTSDYQFSLTLPITTIRNWYSSAD